VGSVIAKKKLEELRSIANNAADFGARSNFSNEELGKVSARIRDEINNLESSDLGGGPVAQEKLEYRYGL